MAKYKQSELTEKIGTPRKGYVEAVEPPSDIPVEELREFTQQFLVSIINRAVTAGAKDSGSGKTLKVHRYPDGGVKWELDDNFPCYLAIYCRDAKVSYTCRMNTINNQGGLKGHVWFDMDEMPIGYFSQLGTACLRDMYDLAYYACKTEYAFEDQRGVHESRPRGFWSGDGQGLYGTPFYLMCEKALITPRSYVAPCIYLSNGINIYDSIFDMFGIPEDEDLEEFFANAPDGDALREFWNTTVSDLDEYIVYIHYLWHLVDCMHETIDMLQNQLEAVDETVKS